MEAYYNLKVVSNSVYFILSIVIMLSGILWNVYYAYHRKSHSYNNEKGYYSLYYNRILIAIIIKSFNNNIFSLLSDDDSWSSINML